MHGFSLLPNHCPSWTDTSPAHASGDHRSQAVGAFRGPGQGSVCLRLQFPLQEEKVGGWSSYIGSPSLCWEARWWKEQPLPLVLAPVHLR